MLQYLISTIVVPLAFIFSYLSTQNDNQKTPLRKSRIIKYGEALGLKTSISSNCFKRLGRSQQTNKQTKAHTQKKPLWNYWTISVGQFSVKWKSFKFHLVWTLAAYHVLLSCASGISRQSHRMGHALGITSPMTDVQHTSREQVGSVL